MTIRQCSKSDFNAILTIINDAAEAYRGVIPADCFHDPYMSAHDLQNEIDAGVVFWGLDRAGQLAGIMGFQELEAVALIRHAYVRTALQGSGIGSVLLSHIQNLSKQSLLVGTWATADWAIGFYQRHGFEIVSEDNTPQLLKRYWTISERQIETSVVLAEV
jgi:N-acetylglutamate synthase-like GNAT family acetyltransferase